MMEEEAGLHWADILVFTAVLVVSAGIGLFYAIKAKAASASPEELLLGKRSLPVLPVTFSLSVGFMSAVSVLGVPSEVYANGSDYWMIGFGFAWSLLFTGLFIMPVIYRLNLTSAYEYLELRFSKPIRLLASLTFIFLMLCYLAVVLYAPALALSSVTDLSMEVSILAIGLVCTFYTALGGIKAVIWTDMFQAGVIIAGMLALIGRGTIEAGGVDAVVEKVVNGSRDATYPMSLDPFIRHTFWTLTMGGGIATLALYGANQATLQRYMAVETLCKARIVIFANIPVIQLYLALMCSCGLVMYGYYQGRDPLISGRIKKRDELIPLFVLDILGKWPGMPGLFIACVFSAALSTVSSGVNSLATVTVADFINPGLVMVRGGLPSRRVQSVIVISTALLYGLITIGCAYLCGLLSSALLIIAASVLGMVGGPLLGVILLGMFCPWVNSWGAGCALISSLVITMWTAIGAILRPFPSSSPPMNGSVIVVPTNDSDIYTIADSPDSFNVNDWYGLSYQHYATLAIIVSFVVGTVVSLVTKCNKGRKLHKGTYYDLMRCWRGTAKKDSSYDLTERDERNSDESVNGVINMYDGDFNKTVM